MVLLTRFERARIIGMRANSLAQGAPPKIPTKGCIDVIEIAEAEFEQNLIPFILQRTLPNGKTTQIILGDGKEPYVKN